MRIVGLVRRSSQAKGSDNSVGHGCHHGLRPRRSSGGSRRGHSQPPQTGASAGRSATVRRLWILVAAQSATRAACLTPTELGLILADLRFSGPDEESRQGPTRTADHAPGLLSLGSDPRRGRCRPSAAFTAVRPKALWEHHRLFTILVAAAFVPRVVASLGFRPALTIRDSFDYMHDGVHLALGQLRPAGYPLLLWLLGPFHSLLLITSLQHLLGIGTAIIVYGTLRHWGLPGWGACLAALPTLFDFRQIALESYILPDPVYGFVIVTAVALLLTRRSPRAWQCVAAGLLIAYASVLRGNGMPFIILALAFMLIRRVGWRAFTAGAAACVLPVLGYMALFYATWGEFNITNSNGFFLWSRTTTFANCKVIKPPADLIPLCPDKAHLEGPNRSPAAYLWAPDSWFRHNRHPGINATNNSLAMRFAVAAIEAQPLGYLKVSSKDVLAIFLATDRSLSIRTMAFTAAPDLPVLPWYWADDLRAYGHTTSNTHAVQPYADLMFLYQRPVSFPGLAFLGVMTAGFVGLLRNRRRWGGPGALPWAAAAISIVLPPMLTWYAYRYALVAVPLSCMAAALAFTRALSWLQSAPAKKPTALPGSGPVPEARAQQQQPTGDAGSAGALPTTGTGAGSAGVLPRAQANSDFGLVPGHSRDLPLASG